MESGSDFDPSFAPDGKKVVFCMNAASGTVLRTIDSDGQNLQELTERRGRFSERDPAWSPDGSKIVFGRYPAICIMDADGGNRRQLLKTGDGMQPRWSPDGKKIAFVSVRDGNGPELFVVGADGTNLKKLTPNGGQHRATNIAWSPDSKQLAYSDNGSPIDWEIFAVDAVGTNHRQLTRLGGSNLHVDWSGDGKKLAFLHLVGGKSVANQTTVYVMDADGRNQIEVYGWPKYLPGRIRWRPK